MATAKKAGAAPAAAPELSFGHAMAPRRGAPGESLMVTDARGVVTEIKADADGMVQPLNGEQVRVADAHNLPYWSDPTAEAAAPGEPAAESAEES